MATEVTPEIQQKIKDMSKTKFIGQICRSLGLSRPTVKKYMGSGE